MARSLKNKPQVQAPSVTYPYGRIRDDDGTGLFGTPVNEDVYGDMHQFFECLLNESDLVANERPENEYDGFQYLSALKTLIVSLAQSIKPPAWKNITLASGWAAFVSGTEAKYRIDQFGKVHLKGRIKGTSSSANFQWAAAGTLPSANTNSRVEIAMPYYPHGGGNVVGIGYVVIEDDGSCYFDIPNGGSSIPTTIDASFSLEGISYWPQGY